MKDADRRPAPVPAMVLCAALTAATAGAWAGGEPVVPFPGTSVPGTSVPGTSVPVADVHGAAEGGDGKSAEASPPGAEAAGSAARPGVSDAVAGDETAEPDAGAEVLDTAGPAADAEPSDAAVPDGAMAAETVDLPAGGSRLLRALADLPATLGPARSGVADEAGRRGAPRFSGTSVFAAEGCPRALLRRLLAGAAGEADALSALGIEREILTLCRERQEILAGLFETEARLSELRDAGRAHETRTPVPAASPEPAVETAAPSPLGAAPGGAAETLVPENASEGGMRAGDTRAAEPRPPHYAWFSIIGTAGALRAGVTDGTGVWFVREGDPLPGGATVAAIAGRPPGVRVTGAGAGGEPALLPFGARPGGVP